MAQSHLHGSVPGGLGFQDNEGIHNTRLPGVSKSVHISDPTRQKNREDTPMRTDIAFKTEDGVTLRGWHYLPDAGRGRLPTIVMAHGFSAVKEMYLDRFAETFAAAGLAAVVFDNRNFGASDGEPRQEIDPWQQVRDYRDAITY